MLKYLVFFLLITVPSVIFSYTIYPEMTEQLLERFHDAMDRELRASEKRVKDKYELIGRGDQIINPATRIEHDALYGSLQAKKTLAANFRNAPSIRSPKVREKLLSILKKRIITADDLYELDDLVIQERKRTTQ